ncbi:MAG: EamA family transporter, partial [Colwellia sp.]
MSASFTNQLEENSNRNGALSALSAYLLWGFAPIYFKLLTDIEPGEILMHRVIWSTVFLLVMVILMKKWSQLVAICQQPKILLQLSLSASFLGVNWFLFIWAVNNNHLLDASLGYYINPLFNVILGMIFFNER